MNLVPSVGDVVKYLVEGLAVAVVALVVLPGRMPANLMPIGVLAATAAASFYVLDKFAPQVAAGARQGTGFSFGQNVVA